MPAQPRWTTCWVGPGAVALGGGGASSSSPHQLGTPLHRGFLPPGGLLDLWAAQMGVPRGFPAAVPPKEAWVVSPGLPHPTVPS